MHTMTRTTLRILAGAVALLAVAACSDAASGDASSPEQAASVEPATIEVTATDYGFTGLPERIAPGTTLTLVNESEVELHELVAVPLPDDETRSVEELIQDPEALSALFPGVATVLIAPPAEGSIAVEGTGTLTEPGRYAIICAIPTGAIPEDYLAAAAEAEGGPPDVPGGPPHFVKGMYAEVIVEG